MPKYAYVVAYGDNSLTIIDISNPAAPAFKGNIAGAGAPNYLGEPAYNFPQAGKKHVRLPSIPSIPGTPNIPNKLGIDF